MITFEGIIDYEEKGRVVAFRRSFIKSALTPHVSSDRSKSFCKPRASSLHIS